MNPESKYQKIRNDIIENIDLYKDNIDLIVNKALTSNKYINRVLSTETLKSIDCSGLIRGYCDQSGVVSAESELFTNINTVIVSDILKFIVDNENVTRSQESMITDFHNNFNYLLKRYSPYISIENDIDRINNEFIIDADININKLYSMEGNPEGRQKIVEGKNGELVEKSEKSKNVKDDIAVKSTKIAEGIISLKKMKDENANKIHLFMDKLNVVNNKFYKDNLGKIDHLYEQYADKVKIVENHILGDPVDILMNKCPEYLKDVSDKIMGAYDNYLKHIDKITKLTSPDDMVALCNKYITYPSSKIPDNAKLKGAAVFKALSKDFRFKIGKILLKNNTVYGHTPESIAEKKFPPIQHLITSLFIKNPHEKPFEQLVSEVFKSADSFKLMENGTKKVIAQSAKLSNDNISLKKISNDYESKAGIANNYKKDALGELSGATPEAQKAFKKESTTCKDIIAKHLAIMESYIPVILYVVSGGSVMYNMTKEINRMCIDAIKLMNQHESEVADKDTDYDTGAKIKKKVNKNVEGNKIVSA